MTGHITIWHILRKNKSMRSELQNIGLAFDVLTPKLSCLIRFSHLIFETNVVERGHSGQISLVVTCTAVCTCHHLKFTAKNWNFGENWSIGNKYKHLSIPNDARLASLKAFSFLSKETFIRGYTGCPKKNGVQLQISIIQRWLDRLKWLRFYFEACSFLFLTIFHSPIFKKK